MLPTSNSFDITAMKITPSKNYEMNIYDEKISGFVDEIEAMRQVIFKILNTERYKFLIYSWNYGIELEDLFGKPKSYVCSEIKRRITEALIIDDRIESVDGFVFDTSKSGVVAVDFVAHTIYGVVAFGKEVSYWVIQLLLKKF